ncbi:hypothetical protein ATO12_10795 [Aquimarina atlantica]|uniref:Uncharacterized protein n=1 Tax=Aquimarina atlantica TaxID=1317122 RepID=A0A023BMV7_9FLAO|nr:hypothetical protein [Aquimarina atlantica]EZH71331.1 hypothetical protein ATO12_10795 [Aquimarina atlantica]
MYKINHEIILKGNAELSNKIFEDKELSNGINPIFKCNKCEIENSFTIIPFNTGFSFSDLIEKEFLREPFLLKEKIVSEAFGIYAYSNKYLVDGLPPIYFALNCKNCNQPHICIFGFGERQQGYFVCSIAGIWEIEEKDLNTPT